MNSYALDNWPVFYNTARGCLFFWCLVGIFGLVWIILMFIKKRIGEGPVGQVYRNDGKQQPSQSQMKPAEDRKIQQNIYQASEKKQDEEKKSQIVASAPKSQKPERSSVAEPEVQQRTKLEKAMYGFQEFLFSYTPFFVINVLNIVCVRTWQFNLVIWFLVVIPVIILNLMGLFIKIQNKYLQCFLKNAWVILGVLWYINFFSILVPYRK